MRFGATRPTAERGHGVDSFKSAPDLRGCAKRAADPAARRAGRGGAGREGAASRFEACGGAGTARAEAAAARAAAARRRRRRRPRSPARRRARPRRFFLRRVATLYVTYHRRPAPNRSGMNSTSVPPPRTRAAGRPRGSVERGGEGAGGGASARRVRGRSRRSAGARAPRAAVGVRAERGGRAASARAGAPRAGQLVVVRRAASNLLLTSSARRASSRRLATRRLRSNENQLKSSVSVSTPDVTWRVAPAPPRCRRRGPSTMPRGTANSTSPGYKVTSRSGAARSAARATRALAALGLAQPPALRRREGSQAWRRRTARRRPTARPGGRGRRRRRRAVSSTRSTASTAPKVRISARASAPIGAVVQLDVVHHDDVQLRARARVPQVGRTHRRAVGPPRLVVREGVLRDHPHLRVVGLYLELPWRASRARSATRSSPPPNPSPAPASLCSAAPRTTCGDVSQCSAMKRPQDLGASSARICAQPADAFAGEWKAAAKDQSIAPRDGSVRPARCQGRDEISASSQNQRRRRVQHPPASQRQGSSLCCERSRAMRENSAWPLRRARSWHGQEVEDRQEAEVRRATFARGRLRPLARGDVRRVGVDIGCAACAIVITEARRRGARHAALVARVDCR